MIKKLRSTVFQKGLPIPKEIFLENENCVQNMINKEMEALIKEDNQNLGTKEFNLRQINEAK